MITKRIPGAEPVEMVYDNRDRLVLTQDANMRSENNRKWYFFKYDKFNRVVMTGIIYVPNSMAGIHRLKFKTFTGDMYETYNATATTFGYSLNNSFPVGYTVIASNVLTVNWYDNYNFKTDLSLASNFGYANYTIPSDFESTASTLTTGRATGSFTKVLDVPNSGVTITNQALYTVNYYDVNGNVIRSIKGNHMGGYDINSTRYEPITFRVLQSEQRHTMPGQTDLTILKSFAYDHVGRLLETTCKINNEAPVVLSAMRYNEIGELVQKYLHSTQLTGTNRPFEQKVDYSYNIRGWLTGINNSALSGSDNDLFGMNLYYNNITGLSASAVTGGSQYNGNIAAIIWNTTGDKTRGYGFNYDGLNRLKEGNYGEGANISANPGFYSESVPVYDNNGNIQQLNRFYQNIQVDALTYTYLTKSNQLLKITDNITGDAIGVSDYVVRSPGASYSWDYNGNMVGDLGKNTGITYNLLNLPESVTFSGGGKLFYHYDAAGNKLAQTVESASGSVDKTTEYIDGIVYQNGQLSFFSTEEGRVMAIRDGANTRWKYEYNLKDHLGNTRVVFSGAPGCTEVMQTNNYYPFGLPFECKNYISSTINYDANKYLYNGKEMQSDGFGGVSLDWYDYGWRMYDPQIGRFHTQDRFTEKYNWMTPYQYGANNPIKFIDVNGDSVWINKTTDENGKHHYTVNFTIAVLNSSDDKDVNDYTMPKFMEQVKKQTEKMFTVSEDNNEVYDVSCNVEVTEIKNKDELGSNTLIEIKPSNSPEFGKKSEDPAWAPNGKEIHINSWFFILMEHGDNTKTIPHELGHIGGLFHPNKEPFYLPDSRTNFMNQGDIINPQGVNYFQIHRMQRLFTHGLLNRRELRPANIPTP
jgi:RHS repeat-associated protein